MEKLYSSKTCLKMAGGGKGCIHRWRNRDGGASGPNLRVYFYSIVSA